MDEDTRIKQMLGTTSYWTSYYLVSKTESQRVACCVSPLREVTRDFNNRSR